jgi:hypothetical protein
MLHIIEYQTVFETLYGQGLQCHYHNSGAFGFPSQMVTQSRGWIGPADASIQPAARALAHSVPPPYEANLAALAERAWLELLPGSVWAMPKSHWAYELEFGNREWMPALLEEIGIDPRKLAGLNNAAAIQFETGDSNLFQIFIQRLLEKLTASDFSLAFPDRGTICTIHSHKQLWWTTTVPSVAIGLDRLLLPV